MTETIKSTRQVLASAELYGFDAASFARRTAARRGLKPQPINAEVDEQQVIDALNAPQVEAEAELPADETAETTTA